MTRFNDRTNTLLYKNIPLTLYSKGWCWLCVRGELVTGIDCYILTQSSSDHSSTSSSFGWAAQPWVTGGPSPLSGAGSHSSILSPTGTTTGTPTRTDCNSNWPKSSVAPGYIIVWHPPASCGRTHLQRIGQSDIPISSTGCTCFSALPLIYTGASLDWRLGQGSICYNCSVAYS